MISFILNARAVEAPGGTSLLDWLRGTAGLTGAKNACGEGSCGACTVLVDGAPFSACILPIEKVAGKSVLTVEGIESAEMAVYERSYVAAGAVQCGYCTPGMVMSTKALLDRNPAPTEKEARAALRRNLCRCTGYAKIVEAVMLAAEARRALAGAGIGRPVGGDSPVVGAADGGAAAVAPELASSAARQGALGDRLDRVDAAVKARGEARYVDDLSVPGMLHAAVLRSPHPRARLISLDLSAARSLPGVVCVASWEDIPGDRFIGHLVADWPTFVAPGELTRYVGDAIALVAAESRELAKKALGHIRAEYELLEPLLDPEAALAPGAPAIHPGGNVLSEISLVRGDAASALASAPHVIRREYATGFIDHAFMETESALAFPPDAEGVVLVRTGEQNVYDGQRYVARSLGIPEGMVRVVSTFVGGAFGGKEDQSVQHHAALAAWLAGRPVKLTLDRSESTRVHVKRHPMRVALELGCDEAGRILGARATVLADTGAYASLGGPVLHRAVTHLGGPYVIPAIQVEGRAVYTNNPPAGAFRGFGVPQTNFAFESALSELAAQIGISAWEIRMLNAARPGEVLSNGQIAGPDTAIEDCLLAVKEAFESAPGRAGIACAFKNTGIGMGHPDTGRCVLAVFADRVEVRTGAACVGQGLATILTQIASSVLDLDPSLIVVPAPDTFLTPDAGTSTASRQTLITGEACRRACALAVEALAEKGGGPSTARRGGAPATAAPPGEGATAFLLAALAGREFYAEFEAETDSFPTDKANPVRHVAYSYACHVAILGEDGRLERMVAAHDSGLVVNPLAFEGQVEGGVVMGLGYALTETFPLEGGVPKAKFGQLGLFRAPDVPQIETLIVRRGGPGSAMDGGTSASAYGAKGIGEISSIPTAAAVAAAYAARDGLWRRSLPLEGTPYRGR
ncbi:MAG TPA: selenium-dependent xanthine dehydrogenase [Rectinemataceae bacterium]|nr:selenium-dependent xanthine dehydrogenase [Rectinemataceae bacterium]